MALTTQQRTRLNTFLVALRDTVIAKQDAYYNGEEVVTPASKDEDGKDVHAITRKRERYWQGRKQNLALVNFLDKADEFSWSDFGIKSLSDLPGKTGLDALNIQIDTYDGPEGKGWQGVLTIEINGTTYTRTYNHGPEAYRNQDWSESTEASSRG